MHQLRSIHPDIKPLAVIGSSSLFNGSIICGHYCPNGTMVAVKCVNVDSCSSNVLALLQREVRLSRFVAHPNIMAYSQMILHDSTLCMIAPLMEYGSCADIMSAYFKYGLPEQVIALILREVLKALAYLHNMHFIHRGLKGSHILVSKNGEVKLSGHRNIIELSRDGVPVARLHDFPKDDTSLLPWLSPEILQQNMQGYDTRSDIYSLGITACELANGHAPFIDMPSTQMLLEKLNGTIPFLLDETTVPPMSENMDDMESSTVNLNHEVTRLSMIKSARSRHFSPLLHKFVTGCLEQELELRPTAEDLLKHPFFKQLKNHTNMEILQPVFKELQPIGNKFQGQDLQQDAELLAGEVEELSLSDVEWDFSS